MDSLYQAVARLGAECGALRLTFFGLRARGGGVIQRFEFTFELAWKALKEYMQEQSSTAELQFPKQILREAYAARLIDDESVWLSMLADHNTASHIYDDKTAADIALRIAQSYVRTLDRLAARL